MFRGLGFRAFDSGLAYSLHCSSLVFGFTNLFVILRLGSYKVTQKGTAPQTRGRVYRDLALS